MLCLIKLIFRYLKLLSTEKMTFSPKFKSTNSLPNPFALFFGQFFGVFPSLAFGSFLSLANFVLENRLVYPWLFSLSKAERRSDLPLLFLCCFREKENGLNHLYNYESVTLFSPNRL